MQMADEKCAKTSEISYELNNQIIEIVNTAHKVTLGAERVDFTSQRRIAFSKRPAKTISVPYDCITEVRHYRVWNWYFLACALLAAVFIRPLLLKWLLVICLLWSAAKFDIVLSQSDGADVSIRYSALIKESAVSEDILGRIHTKKQSEPSTTDPVITEKTERQESVGEDISKIKEEDET